MIDDLIEFAWICFVTRCFYRTAEEDPARIPSLLSCLAFFVMFQKFLDRRKAKP